MAILFHFLNPSMVSLINCSGTPLVTKGIPIFFRSTKLRVSPAFFLSPFMRATIPSRLRLCGDTIGKADRPDEGDDPLPVFGRKVLHALR